SNFADDTVQRLDTSADTVAATLPFGDGAQDMTIVEPMGESDPWADEVVSFRPGSPWSQFGYAFFPENVLGPPDPNSAINEYFGSGSEEEVLSLGGGGEITLKFSDNVIVDGPGVDFLVFENVIINAWTNQPFMEAGIVSVSQDGENFVQFPYDTTSHSGLAGITPVKSTQHPTNPDSSGADGFDLADLGLQWVRYVRITDMGDIWQEGPYNGDFDLDAVVAVNSAAEEPTLVASKEESVPENFTLLQNYPNPFNPETQIAFHLAHPSAVALDVYSISGQFVRRLVAQKLSAGQYEFTWNGKNEFGQNAASGIYLAHLQADGVQKSIKMSLVR
ncbi:MAG: T9SS type A sorting domain-containing protein, partial [Calditrichaeota bacterium]|nr:T9SS type A sorting domain-containing protein [Calditrichota bacterium]